MAFVSWRRVMNEKLCKSLHEVPSEIEEKVYQSDLSFC